MTLRMVIVFSLMIALSSCGGDEQHGIYTGYVEAEYVNLSAHESGRITKLLVEEGQTVAAGDPIAAMDDTLQQSRLRAAQARAANLQTGARPQELAALDAQLQEAQARLREAQAAYDRWTPLVAEDFASAARGDQVRADLDAAKARFAATEEAIAVAQLGGRDQELRAALAAVDEAAWRLDERTITAPANGRVEIIFHRQGETASAGAPIVALLPDAVAKVRFFVPQSMAPTFSHGDVVEVYADGSAAPVDARISFIASEPEFTPPVIYSRGSREKLVFMIEARLPNDAGLHPGLPVDVSKP